MKLENYKPEHIVNLSKDEASINLFSEIGGEGISGQAFADEIQLLNEFGVANIDIHIVSPGGSVLDGQAIFTAIINSDAHVTTFIDGAAASMAAIIALAGHTVKMSDRGSLMIHDPHTGGVEADENALKALSALREGLLTILERRSDLSRAKLSKIMDQETWILPEDALKAGMVDEVVKTKKTKRQSAAAIMEIFNSYNKNIIKNESDMKDIAKHFGLIESASEADIIKAAIKVSDELETTKEDLIKSVEDLKTSEDKVIDLEAKLLDFEASAKELNDTLIEETIEEGVEKGIFKEDAKNSLMEAFAGNLDGLKNVMGNISEKAPNIINQLNDSTPESKSKLPKDLAEMNWRDADKAGRLEEIKDIDKDSYFALYKATYKTDHPSFIAQD
jgi:ATP-dependent protease ClpP protease subunit